MIVTRTPTIMDGVVYRWRWTENQEDRPVLSASRKGVGVHDTHLVAEDAADALRDALYDAWQVYRELADGRDPTQFLSAGDH